MNHKFDFLDEEISQLKAENRFITLHISFYFRYPKFLV